MAGRELKRRLEIGETAHVLAQESGPDLADAERLSRPYSSRLKD
jgi:hypothetical protein